jgi:hypothetical protein
MSLLAHLFTWLNVPANALGRALTPFVENTPGWLSITIISAVAGVVFIMIFKYTSNQKAIGRAKDKGKAHTLAIKLFKDDPRVTITSLGGAIGWIGVRFFWSLSPLLVMAIPFVLLMGQMSLWYQARPLRIGEEARVTMQLAGDPNEGWYDVQLPESTLAEVSFGPMKVFAENQMLWTVRATAEGSDPLKFMVHDQHVAKSFAVGEGFMRVSALRPGPHWLDIMMYPAEEPFEKDSAVRSVSVEYPDRLSNISGTGSWVVYFFVVCIAFGFAFMPIFKVKI